MHIRWSMVLLLFGLSLLVSSVCQSTTRWGPSLAIKGLPPGWQGDCVERPRALAQCGIWRDSAGLVRLLITHYAEGNQSLLLYLPESPPAVRVAFITGTPTQGLVTLAPAATGDDAQTLEVVLQYCSRI